MQKIILHIENACIGFEQGNLFDDFNLSLPAGSMFSLTGESGSGKTTLLKAILGLVPLKHGKIEVENIEVNMHNLPKTRAFSSWIPQELAIPVEWVNDMVQTPFKLKVNRVHHFSEEKLLHYFEELGLSSDLYNRRLSEISGGQRQRIMIAATALLNKPLMLIDEPTSALDHESVIRVIAFLQRRKEEGMAILAVTHDDYFASHCDKQLYL